jgi:maltose alpha-D-glucosyltransferase/alpha-amylase
VQAKRPESWERALRQAFATAYLGAISGAGEHLLAGPDDIAASLFPSSLRDFELQKALAELRYELGHRPDWLWVPLSGILEILGR